MPAESFLYLFGIGMLPFQILGVIAYLICRKKNAAGAKLLHRLIPPVTFSIFIAGWWISIKPVNEETLFGPDLLIFLLIFFVDRLNAYPPPGDKNRESYWWNESV